jgi:hypothetical protein
MEVNSTGLIMLQTKTYDQKSVLSLLAQNIEKLASSNHSNLISGAKGIGK